eukprot:scaffold241_cov242-Pinguiococcus_pyrenoidosus.AAC.7
MAPPGGAAASLDANDYSRFENIGTEDEDNKMDEVEADAPPLMELVRRAEACKEQGNEKFRAGTIAEARQSYEEGLEQMKTAEDKGCLKMDVEKTEGAEQIASADLGGASGREAKPHRITDQRFSPTAPEDRAKILRGSSKDTLLNASRAAKI